jgi:ribosomal protein L29
MKGFKGKTKEELEKTLKENETALHNFRFGTTGSKTRNVREARNLRKSVAQIKTELNREKALAK